MGHVCVMLQAYLFGAYANKFKCICTSSLVDRRLFIRSIYSDIVVPHVHELCGTSDAYLMLAYTL